MPKKASQKWNEGDYFAVPLKDGSAALGQVLAYEPSALNSVVCALWGTRVDPDQMHEPPVEQLISVLLVTRDLLDSGRWAIVGSGKRLGAGKYFAFLKLKVRGFVGAKIFGSANVETLLNAYFGLAPWGGFADPQYLDKMLISPNKKPAGIGSPNNRPRQ